MEELPASPADRFTRYKFIRDEIIHEDNLIGLRLSWFTASQAFLLSALAIAQGQQHGVPNARTNYFFPMLPIVAITTDLLIFAGIVAGLEALRCWRRMLSDNPADYADFPRIHKDRGIIRFGWAAPVGLPIAFLFAWIYLLIAGL